MRDVAAPSDDIADVISKPAGGVTEKTPDPTLSEDEGIRALYRLLLLREPDPHGLALHLQLLRKGLPFEQIMRSFLHSHEFPQQQSTFEKAYFDSRNRQYDDDIRDFRVPDLAYRCPGDLLVRPLSLRRVVVIGQCLLVAWPKVIESMMPGCQCDFFLFNRVQRLPERLPAEPSEYDFQIVNIPLLSVLPEWAFFRLSYEEPEAYEKAFREACDRLGAAAPDFWTTG